MNPLVIGLVIQVISFLEGIWETLNDGDSTDDFADGIKSLKRAVGNGALKCDHEEEKEG